MEEIPTNDLRDFMTAIDEADFEKIRFLLDEVLSLDDAYEECPESTPLYKAVKNGYTDIVKFLIRYEANVDMRLMTENMGTLLHMVVKKNGKETEEMCKILVKAGVNVNQGDRYNLTPLYVAIDERREDVVRVLLELGADVNSRLKDGTALLHRAAELGLGRTCELLIQRGADLNVKNDDGLTALHIAAIMGFSNIMDNLLISGAYIDASDVDGNTALHLASKSGQAQAVLSLIENGADVNIVNKKGQTAFQIATSRKWTTYQLDLLKMQIATNKGNLEDLGITTDISEQVQLMMKYEEEVQRMRSLEIKKTNVTFHDILTKRTDQIALYLKNKDVQALIQEDYQREFPEYAGLIKARLIEGSVRKMLLDEGRRVLLSCFSKPQDLPERCTDKILSYLSNRKLTDLKIDCDCYGFLMMSGT